MRNLSLIFDNVRLTSYYLIPTLVVGSQIGHGWLYILWFKGRFGVRWEII